MTGCPRKRGELESRPGARVLELDRLSLGIDVAKPAFEQPHRLVGRRVLQREHPGKLRRGDDSVGSFLDPLSDLHLRDWPVTIPAFAFTEAGVTAYVRSSIGAATAAGCCTGAPSPHRQKASFFSMARSVGQNLR